MTAGASITLRGLSKRFGAVSAVDSVTLTIPAGAFVTLLGPSGSGKTTTLMMIAGFQSPSDGDILLGERSISDLPPYRRDMGVVFQNYALFPHLTVRENVAFPLRMRRVSRAEMASKVAEALALVKLPGYEERYPAQLSGGQQQRVALARALVFRPPVILMDEPLGALDKQLREHMQLEIKQLQRALGTTVVYVTHDQGEALTMSDAIVVMNHGRVEQVGSPQEVYERPSTRFVAQFLGDSNFLEGRLDAHSDPERAEVRAGALRIVVKPNRSISPDSAVSVVVRPEKVLLDSEAEHRDNRLNGTVEEIVYSGDRAKYRLRIEGAPDIQLLSSRPIRTSLPSLELGRPVRVGWDAEDSQMIRNVAGAAADHREPGDRTELAVGA